MGKSTVADKPVEAPEEPKTLKGFPPTIRKGTWSGIPMFECSCGETTFDEEEARTHICKRPKPAPSE